MNSFVKNNQRYCAYIILMLILVCFGSCQDENSDELVQKSFINQKFDLKELNEVSRLDHKELIETVVKIEGTIEDINFLNDRSTIILSDKKYEGFSAICDMQKAQSLKFKDLKLGDTITIKGILKGALKDIILLNCIIVNNQPDE